MKKFLLFILLLHNTFLLADEKNLFDAYLDGSLWGIVRNDANYSWGMQMHLECNYFSVPDVLTMASLNPPQTDCFVKADFLSLPEDELSKRFSKYFFNLTNENPIGWNVGLGIYNVSRKHFLYWSIAGDDVGSIFFNGSKMTIVYANRMLDSIPFDLNDIEIENFNRKVIEYDKNNNRVEYYYESPSSKGRKSTGRILIKGFEKESLNEDTRNKLKKRNGYSPEYAKAYAMVKKLFERLNRYNEKNGSIEFSAKNELGDVLACYFPSTYTINGERHVFSFKYENLDFLQKNRASIKNVFVKPIMLFSFAGQPDSYYLSKRNYMAYYYDNSFMPIIESAEYKGKYYIDSNEFIWEPRLVKNYNNVFKYIVRPQNLLPLKWVITKKRIDEYEKVNSDWIYKGSYWEKMN